MLTWLFCFANRSATSLFPRRWLSDSDKEVLKVVSQAKGAAGKADAAAAAPQSEMASGVVTFERGLSSAENSAKSK